MATLLERPHGERKLCGQLPAVTAIQQKRQTQEWDCLAAIGLTPSVVTGTAELSPARTAESYTDQWLLVSATEFWAGLPNGIRVLK